MSTTTTPTPTADDVPNDGKEGQEIKEEHTIVSLKKDGLLHSTCYSSYFPDGIKTFSPWTRIPNAVPCHYDPFEYDKLRKTQKCKQIERSKIFEYMCMSYLLNNFVQNQTVVSTIPLALQEIYKLSVSAAPFFNLRYQPYLFITDNTALYDVNFERFYDCTDNVIIERFFRSLKYEEIYLNPSNNVKDLKKQIQNYVYFYNNERLHQSLDYKTPKEIFFNKII